MITRAALQLAGVGCLSLLLGACVSTPPVRNTVVVETVDGGHLRILSGYLQTGVEIAVVRGMVRRAPLWRGPVDGHLHISGFGHDGALVVRRATRWTGNLGGRSSNAATYQSDLGIPAAKIARVTVAYAPGRHKPSEGFQ
jgi:hypothetical protein